MPSRWLVGCFRHRNRVLRYEACLPFFVWPAFVRHCHTPISQQVEGAPLRKQLKDASKLIRNQKRSPSPHNVVEDHVSEYELTVGIEIHAQLNSPRKLFSRASADGVDDPNTDLDSFDIAVPGSQPLFQLSNLVPAIRAALALGCTIKATSYFDRKHYFYHDQPAGYQITQYYHPFAEQGSILLTSEDGLPESDGETLEVGIKQVQMEQDTAKTTETENGTNLVDFTRSGHALIEIISMPDIHSPEAAAAYLRKVQAILYSVDAVTTGMELGGLRADVNVSVLRIDGPSGPNSYNGTGGLGQRTEIKNLSSFKAVEDAVKAERDRQINILESGGAIEGETRGWSLSHPNETRRLRGKEGEVDYRYMPDPDIPPLRIADEVVEHLKETLPPIPEQLVNILVTDYGLSTIDAKSLISLDDGLRLIYFQDVIAELAGENSMPSTAVSKTAANWVLHELGSLLSSTDMKWTPQTVSYEDMADIVRLLTSNQITGTSAKTLLRIVFDSDHRVPVSTIVEREELWFRPMTDSEYETLIAQVVKDNEKVVKDIRDKGKHGKIMFLVGQVMRSGDRNRMEASKLEVLLREKLVAK